MSVALGITALVVSVIALGSSMYSKSRHRTILAQN
jgi:hypothetical protein